MQRMAKIIDRNWHNLTNKRVLNRVVHISKCGDITPYKNGPVFLANKVFVTDCDKNFVFYWLDKQTFPVATEIYLSSHPCEPFVFNQFSKLYLSDRFSNYKKRWGHAGIICVKDQSIEDDINDHSIEPIQTEDIKQN
jgi:hypothetical protein